MALPPTPQKGGPRVSTCYGNTKHVSSQPIRGGQGILPHWGRDYLGSGSFGPPWRSLRLPRIKPWSPTATPQGPNACLPSETIPQPSSLPLSPKLWWTGNSRGLTDCRSHLARGYMSFLFFQSLLLSASIKREGESPTASPHSSTTDDLHHSDRYQVRRDWVSVRRKPPWMKA